MLPAFVVILACATGFALSSLWPWRHLIDGGYIAQFLVLTAGLLALALLTLAWARRRWPGRDVWLGLLCGLGVFVPVSLWNDNGPINVVLLHFDSLRAASTSLHGYGRKTTPRLDELVDERGAVMFESFFAQSGGSNESAPAILASIYPSMFYDPARDDSNYRVPDRFPLLSEYLSNLGYSSFMFSSNPAVPAAHNYDRGWDAFEEVSDEATPQQLVDRMKQRIESAENGPFFSFGLVLAPSMPYQPSDDFNVFVEDDAVDQAFLMSRLAAGDPVEMWIDSLMALYDGEVLEVDAAVGDLVDFLDEEGLWEHTLFIVTSDHGEKFLAKGELGHGGTLFEELIHVPLVWSFPSPLKFPRIEPRLDRYTALASHVDVAPTILGFVSGEVPEGPIQGHDLTRYIFGEHIPLDFPVLIEDLESRSWRRALRTRRWKAMWDDTPEGSARRLFNVGSGLNELEVPIHDGAATDRLATLEDERDRLLGRILTYYEPKPAGSAAIPAATHPGAPSARPAKGKPANAEPAKPEPAKPEPAKPEPAKPEPAKPEPAKPEAAKPEPAKPEPAQPEAQPRDDPGE